VLKNKYLSGVTPAAGRPEIEAALQQFFMFYLMFKFF
jgi:hypothetical protein